MSDLNFVPMGAVVQQLRGEPEPHAPPEQPDIESALRRYNTSLDKRTPTSKPRSLREVKAELRARLRDVEREIKKRHGLERERDEILRLLHAANTKPSPVVRPIRAATG